MLCVISVYPIERKQNARSYCGTYNARHIGTHGMHQQIVAGLFLLAYYLRHARRHRNGGNARGTDKRIDLAAGKLVHKLGYQHAASSTERKRAYAHKQYAYGLPGKEYVSGGSRADGYAEEYGDYIHQLILRGLGKPFGHAAFLEQVTKHQHADKRSRRGNQQGHEYSNNYGEYYLFGFGNRPELLHGYLAFLLCGQRLHYRRLNYGNKRHVRIRCNGNVGFKQLYADEVISDSVAAAYGGPLYLYVNTSYSGTSDTYFRSLGDAVKAVNNRFLRSNVVIYLPSGTSEVYEPAGTQIQGITGPGKLTIYGYANSRLNSYISVKGYSAHICFQNLSLREIRTLNGSNRNPYLIDLQMNHHVELNNCTLDANNVTYDSIYCRTTHVYLYNCGLYNALQGLEVYMGWAYVQSCKGSCSWAMVSYAGYIICSGTVPSGSRSKGNNGQIFDTGVTTDYGTAIPVVTPDNTALMYATTTKSYRGGWRSDTQDVVQGVYSASGYKSSLSWNYGCMWFSTLRTILSGTTIKSATLTLNRKTGSGSGSAKTLYLCAITNTSASGAPSIAVNYGAIGSIGRGETATFAIPVAAVQGLASGTYGGLCLYESPYNFGSSTYSKCYMRMSGSDTSQQPYLRVVYNGGDAVG